MKEKKNIDRIFQEKFKDFEQEPNERVWENIASRLDKQEKKRPLIIPLWWKLGGVAAVMAIILASLIFTNNQDFVTGEPKVVFDKTEESGESENVNNGVSEKERGKTTPEHQVAAEDSNSEQGEENGSTNNRSSSGTGNSAISNNTKDPSPVKSSENKYQSTEKTNTAIAEENFDNSKEKNEKERSAIKPAAIPKDTVGIIAQSNETIIDSTEASSILEEENALAEVEKENKKEEEEEVTTEAESKKMRLSTFAAPVFYKNIGSGNELSNQLSNNATSSEVTLAYGVKFAYKISNKLKIRTGVSRIDINKKVQDISYSPSAMSIGFENISPLEDNVEIRDNSPAPSGSGLPMGPMTSNNALTTAVATPGELNQQFGYIEVPLELEYALIDKKFGLNIIGGGSSLFLDKNRVQLISGEMKTDLGEATNINSTSFSTNIGLGMDYKLTDKFSINVEPIFKYQINTFNKVNNVQPVNFGIYSGLSFRF